MTRRPHVHVITPGDHFSPRTGSAVPTVVDGLARATPPGLPRPSVAVTTDSYPDRYPSADAITYEATPARAVDRYVDAARGRLGLSRKGAQRLLAAAVSQQAAWAPSVVLGHNLPQLIPLVDGRHCAVLYAHNHVLRSYTPRESWQTLRSAPAIVAVSAALAEQLSGHLTPSLRQRVRVVINGVDCTRFRPDPTRMRGDRLHVVFIGRVIRDKGPDVLLEALRLLGREDISVTLVGSNGFDAGAPLTPYEQGLRSQAAALAGPVSFVPFVPRSDLANLLRGADVLVVPSRWPEPCGLTVLEGLATGLAVVASRIGGIPEAIGSAGTLVPPDDPRGLADALELLADDEPARAALGATARAHALAHDWAWAAARLDEALEPLT